MANEILIVDDNSDIRKLISGILKDKGFIVREAANFDQALLEIKKKLPDASVTIEDLRGDGDHYSAVVISKSFMGKSKIEQHKIVYNSLKGKMGNELHALSITTKEK